VCAACAAHAGGWRLNCGRAATPTRLRRGCGRAIPIGDLGVQPAFMAGAARLRRSRRGPRPARQRTGQGPSLTYCTRRTAWPGSRTRTAAPSSSHRELPWRPPAGTHYCGPKIQAGQVRRSRIRARAQGPQARPPLADSHLGERAWRHVSLSISAIRSMPNRNSGPDVSALP